METVPGLHIHRFSGYHGQGYDPCRFPGLRTKQRKVSDRARPNLAKSFESKHSRWHAGDCAQYSFSGDSLTNEEPERHVKVLLGVIRMTRNDRHVDAGLEQLASVCRM